MKICPTEGTNALGVQLALSGNFSKGTSFKEITDEQVTTVQEKLNHRPRKTLGFKTPYEFFFGNIKEGLLGL